MNEIIFKLPSRITILIANTNIALAAFFLYGMLKGVVGGIMAAVIVYYAATIFLFTIFNVRGGKRGL